MDDVYPMRKNMRFRNYDYASRGAYFVTICTDQRIPYFQDVACKETVEQIWRNLPERFPSIRLDVFAILPDRIHGIIWLEPTETAQPKLWEVIRVYKSLVYHYCIDGLRKNSKENIRTLWQKGYYDRILNTDDAIEHTRLSITSPIQQGVKGNYSP